MNNKTYYDAGRQLADEGKWKQSLECFERSLRLESDHPITHQLLALSYAKMRDYDKSVSHLRYTLSIQNENLGALLLLVKILLIIGHGKSALMEYRQRVSSGIHKTLHPYMSICEGAYELFDISSKEKTDIEKKYKNQICSIQEDPTALL